MLLQGHGIKNTQAFYGKASPFLNAFQPEAHCYQIDTLNPQKLFCQTPGNFCEFVNQESKENLK